MSKQVVLVSHRGVLDGMYHLDVHNVAMSKKNISILDTCHTAESTVLPSASVASVKQSYCL